MLRHCFHQGTKLIHSVCPGFWRGCESKSCSVEACIIRIAKAALKMDDATNKADAQGDAAEKTLHGCEEQVVLAKAAWDAKLFIWPAW